MGQEEKSMGGFKLLAIRPLEECSPKFKKKLKDGVIYKFFQDYKFTDVDGLEMVEEFNNLNRSVHYIDNTSNDHNLYKFDEKIDINITAVVGKNGSGKSTLMELFFLAIYLIDYKNILAHKKLKEDQFLVVNKENSFNEILKHNEKYLNGIANTERERRFFRGLEEFKTNQLKLEIYYNHSNNIFRLTIDTNLKDEKNWYKIDKLGDVGFTSHDIQDRIPFYSIALNYSIHSLNSIDMGIWLESIFHKNDGYQTPLVINPKRDEGTIDIENEKELQKSRLLVNTLDILSDENAADPLFNGKQITKVVFKYKFNNRNTSIRGAELLHLDVPLIGAPFENINKESKYRIKKIQEIFKTKKYKQCSWIEKEVYGYLTYKSERIIEHYPNIFKGGTFEEKLKLMVDYDSHITYKLKQAINFINNDNFLKEACENFQPELIKDAYGNGLDGFAFSNDPKIEVVVNNLDDNLKKQILSALAEKTEEQILFLPPAIFDYDFHFSHDPNDTFEKLSSGEKQQIYSIHTIMYHIRNVSSVKESDEIMKYRNINILLDEIELYFHPEMQRHFIIRLMKSIKELKKYLFGNIDSINIILATHSPFILSDIPSTNILRLEEGVPSHDEFGQTFSANIFDLFLLNFFMSSTIGAFAEEKINGVIEFQNKVVSSRDKVQIEELKREYLEEKKDMFHKIIMSIGDDVIKGILENNLIRIEEKLGVGNFIDARINELQAEIARLSKNSENVKD